MPSQYSRDVKAEALALVELGVPASEAAKRLNIGCARTVQRWAERCRQVSTEQDYPQRMAEWYRLTARTQAKLHDGLDAIQDDDTALKHLSQLTVLAGVGTDKILRDREPKYGASIKMTGPIVIVTHAQRPEIIEGEATDVTNVTEELTEGEP